MEFFKKKSLLAMAAMFAASALFVGCGGGGGGEEDPNPDTGGSGFNPSAPNVVLLDDFEEKLLDDDGNTGYTNQNSIANRKGDNGGTWYGYASTNGAKVLAYDESGNEIEITVNGSTTESGMLLTLGTGSLVAALDALGAVDAGGDYYAAIVTPFLGDDDTEVNLSGLKSIRIKGKLKGALRIEIESAAITDWAHWGWGVGDNSEQNPNYKNIDVELAVSSMVGPGWKSTPSVDKGTAFGRATVISLALDTTNDTRVDLEIDAIYLIFNSESSVPYEFK